MKKSLAVFLSILYLVVISGLPFQLHYCGGQLASINLSLSNKEHICPCGDKAMKDDCCKNKCVCIKVKGDQKRANSFAVAFRSIQTTLFSLAPAPLISLRCDQITNITNYHALPPRCNALLIFNSEFRI